MTSAIACPYQCITNTTDSENKEAFTVCNQRGICAADPEAQFVRCLCDEGWTGVFCDQIDSDEPTVSPTEPPTIGREAAATKSSSKGGFVAVICILVVVILVIFGIGYFVYRNQKLKISQQEDEISFHKMSDKGIVGKDTVSTNVVTDDTGKRGFATIGSSRIDREDDDK
eukprot:UN03178